MDVYHPKEQGMNSLAIWEDTTKLKVARFAHIKEGEGGLSVIKGMV